MDISSFFVRRTPRGKTWSGVIAYRDNGRMRQKTKVLKGAETKTDAKRMLAEWVREVEADNSLQLITQDAISYCLDYIDYKLSLRSIQPSSATDYKKSLRGWKPYLDGISLNNLKREHIEQALQAMFADGLANNMVLKRYVALNMCLDAAVETHKLKQNPMKGIPRPKQTKAQQNALVGAELQRLYKRLAELPLSEWVVGVSLCLYAGLRAEEVCGLRVSDIEDIKGWVRRAVGYGEGQHYIAPPKNGKSRDFPICEILGDVLRRWIQENDLAPQHYLIGREKARGVHYISRKWSMFCEIEGFKGQADKKPSLHDLRHTFATQCVKHGMDIKTLQSILGHSSAAITLDVYSSADPGAKADAASLIDSFVTSISR